MTTPSDDLFEWASDANWTSGAASGNPTKGASPPSAATIAQGIVGRVSLKAEHLNACLDNHRRWIEHSMDRVENLGDGSDGDVTISSGTTTLTRDMQYNSLTVTGTGTLNTAGYRVLSRTTITIDTGGTISVQPGDQGSLRSGVAGAGGGTSGNPGGPGSGADALGGDGGDGGTGDSGGNAGGSGGTAAQPPISDRTRVARYVFDGVVSLFGGGGGGGGAGGDTGNGGNGGQGGGIVYLACEDLVWSGGAIEAIGEDGSPGAGSSNGGGGGGGGGGTAFLRRRTETGTATITLTGGSGGAGDGTGNTGTNGSAGVTIREDI